jgi:hypothetical protein
MPTKGALTIEEKYRVVLHLHHYPKLSDIQDSVAIITTVSRWSTVYRIRAIPVEQFASIINLEQKRVRQVMYPQLENEFTSATMEAQHYLMLFS